MKRREFLESAAAAGAGMLLHCAATRAAETPLTPPAEPIHVALIGSGVQGRNLIVAALPIPGVRFRAVCDVWKQPRRAARFYLETYKQQVTDYADYQDLLAQEKGLHAAIIATPDGCHAEQTIACLNAGLHVYCEKTMSNSLEGARAMVRAARQTGKLLQIGYQRRSNPRYLHVCQGLLRKAQLPGRLTHAEGAWFHPVREDVGWPKKFGMRDEELKPYGYSGMHELRNWRFFKKHGGGAFGDFGAHQVDVVNWFLGANPKSVLASGAIDFYKTHEWYDNVIAVLEYETPQGTLRVLCRVETTTSGSGEVSYEHFFGTDGSIKISENPKSTRIFREPHAREWDDWVRQGLLIQKDVPAVKKPVTSEEEHVRETGVVIPYELPVVLDKPQHQPHLENFFDAIRGRAQLNCRAEEAFRTEVVWHKVNAAVEARKLLPFAAEDFQGSW
jgi:predicted dehydrogenase